MDDLERIGPGDVVHHGPSGEDWVVAYADYERGELGWSGWPEGIAKLSDCTLKEKATPEQRAESIVAWSVQRGSDHRYSAVRRLYADELAAIERAAEQRLTRGKE